MLILVHYNIYRTLLQTIWVFKKHTTLLISKFLVIWQNWHIVCTILPYPDHCVLASSAINRIWRKTTRHIQQLWRNLSTEMQKFRFNWLTIRILLSNLKRRGLPCSDDLFWHPLPTTLLTQWIKIWAKFIFWDTQKE